jgi:hypothetical protein
MAITLSLEQKFNNQTLADTSCFDMALSFEYVIFMQEA